MDVSEKGWAWKPPGMQLNQPLPDKEPSKIWSWSVKHPKPVPEWEQLLEMPPSKDQLVDTSREAFEDLLRPLKHAKELDLTDVNPILDFLASSANEPEANNTIRLIKWLTERSADKTAWQAITNLICDKIELATIEDEELLDVIRTLPQARAWQQHGSACHELHQSYFSFWKSLGGKGSCESSVHQTIFMMFAETSRDQQACSDLIKLVSKAAANVGSGKLFWKNIFASLKAISQFKDEENSRLVSQFASALDKLPSNIRLEVLAKTTTHICHLPEGNNSVRQRLVQLWLVCLKSTASFTHFCEVMDAVYAKLAIHFKMSDLAMHFKELKPAEIVDIMLRVWLPLTKTKPPGKIESTVSKGYQEIKLLQPDLKDPSVACLPIISRIFWAYNSDEKALCAWENLLRAYSRVRVRYDALATEVLAISQAIDPPRRVHDTFNRLRNSPRLAIPTSAGVSIVKYYLDKELPRRALSVFRETPSISITDVPELLASMIKDGSFRTNDIMELLLRQPEKIPMEWRSGLKLDLNQEHVDLVHMIAYDTATASSLNPRAAFRHVWAFYRFLQDRGAPLQALMSRAMVQVGILRPLQEHLWIPDERLDYILSVVERIEGPEMREKVQDIARHMRNSVHDQVLAKREIKERAAWMNSSKAMAAKTRYRFKKWTKENPVRRRNGPFYLPKQRTMQLSTSGEV